VKISLITPAAKQSKNGNRTTALRWARLLRGLGHQVRIDVEYDGAATDVMIAIHAWRSAASVRRYRDQAPTGPLIVALAGTDVNTYLATDRAVTLSTMDAADALICLHELIGQAIPVHLRDKLQIVRQSAQPLAAPRRPGKRNFDICVIGHLRDEKDPFRAALAARQLGDASKIRIRHLGKAHTPEFATQARAEMAANPRYHWFGEVPGWRVRRALTTTQAMVISSRQEGGANVVSEAIAAGVPVIASDIAGNIGLLGPDYPGYYPVGNTDALARLLARIEAEADFMRELEGHIHRLQPLFLPNHEAAALENIVRLATKN